MGIIDDDEFKQIIIASDLYLTNIKRNISDVYNDISELNKNFSSQDIRFLPQKLNSELDYFQNVISKIQGYYWTLNNVLGGYVDQATQNANDISKFTS